MNESDKQNKLSTEASTQVHGVVMPRLEPQPLNGKPFRIHFVNRGDEYWYNERLGYKNGRAPMLMSWKCPFGVNGEPVLVDGVWRWQLVMRNGEK